MGIENFFNNYFAKWNVTGNRCKETDQIQKSENDSTIFVKEDLDAFLGLMKDPIVMGFLDVDTCFIMADKYLIAIAFTYFTRAHIPRSKYNRYYFFLALYLAHDMEEDEEDEKQSILPWLFGKHHTGQDMALFQKKKNELWIAMDYRANVSLNCCKKVMDMIPDSDAWKRERDPAHSGALRPYGKEPKCRHCLCLPSNPYPYPCPSCCSSDIIYANKKNSDNESEFSTSLVNSEENNDDIDDLICNSEISLSDEEPYNYEFIPPFKKLRNSIEE